MNHALKIVLAGTLLVGCHRSSDDNQNSSVSRFGITPEADVWCQDSFTVICDSHLVVAKGSKDKPQLELFEAGHLMAYGEEVVSQSIDLPGFTVLGASASSELANSGSPAFYVIGCEAATGEGQIHMYADGGAQPFSSDPAQTLNLGVGQTPVDLTPLRLDFWWLATTDAQGSVTIHRLRDFDFDLYPETVESFANLDSLAQGYPAVIGSLTSEPFAVQQGESDDEVLIEQDGEIRMRLRDTNGDGTADQALFRDLGVSQGPATMRGVAPGSSRVEVVGFPGSEVEVWEVDFSGIPLVLLGVGTASERSSAIVDIWPPLSEGQFIAGRNSQTGRFGYHSEVEPSASPNAIGLSDPFVSVGDTVEIYVSGATQDTVQVNWVFMSKHDWPYTTELACEVVETSEDVFAVTIPDSGDDHHPGFQSLAVSMAGDGADDAPSAILPINVEGTPCPDDSDTDGDGDGGDDDDSGGGRR